MKKILFAVGLGLLGGCTSPKYTASFNYRESDPGYTSAPRNYAEERSVTTMESQQLLASTSRMPIITSEPSMVNQDARKTYAQMSGQERKVFRHQVKKEIKNYVQSTKKQVKANAARSSGVDHDLKLAAIFGAVGIVALIIGGDIFYVLGAIALIIGVVFFVKWLVRQ